ncbi:MAG: type II toxin-antitoxin system VapC family toxin [Pseudanabaena sp.]|jgi:predicted nucleic acid-binding protein
MKILFGDACHWIALLFPKDQRHQVALKCARIYSDDQIITTDGIIDEILNYASIRGSLMRQKALAMCTQMLREPNIEVVPYTPELRKLGFDLYEQRPDKGYSLTDCISMSVMRQMNITGVLTGDRHFQQEGFTILF